MSIGRARDSTNLLEKTPNDNRKESTSEKNVWKVDLFINGEKSRCGHENHLPILENGPAEGDAGIEDDGHYNGSQSLKKSLDKPETMVFEIDGGEPGLR